MKFEKPIENIVFTVGEKHYLDKTEAQDASFRKGVEDIVYATHKGPEAVRMVDMIIAAREPLKELLNFDFTPGKVSAFLNYGASKPFVASETK